MKFRIILVWILCLMTVNVFAANKKLGLLDAVKNKVVKFDVKRTDKSYNGTGLEMQITNLSKEPVVIKVDPALLFQPEDTAYQDLIIPGNELLFVSAGKSNSIELQTYCGKSKAMAPGKDLAFAFKKQCDSNMIKTFDYIREIQADKHLTQEAVWFLTDAKPNLSGIYSDDVPEVSMKLMKFLGKITNTPIPNYRFQRIHNTQEGAIAQESPIMKLHVDLEWEMQSPEILSLSIFDEKNTKIESFFEEKHSRKGRGKITASFETSKYPKGTYYVRLYNDIGNVLAEEKVKLE